ncbi:MAG: Rieske 2Fe-2S domain-containing protein [Cyclobacteriaceae bacterium]|nr:Rieske 2Fe-2S domain-containing protein [Cyclobacteriaceae bacterium]
MEWIKIFESNDEIQTKLNQNTPFRMIIQGKSICIVMRQSVLYAFENKCPHNGETLSKGSINYLGEIVCPWHGYRFNVKTGRECAERCRDLETFPVKETEEGVFIAVTSHTL